MWWQTMTAATAHGAQLACLDLRAATHLGDEQRVATRHREGVQEGERVLRLKQLVARHLAINDLLEDVVGVICGRRVAAV